MCFSPWRGVLSSCTFIVFLFTGAINCTEQVDIKSDHFVNLTTNCLTVMHAELWYSNLYKHLRFWTRPASWLGGQSSWLLTMRSRVRFPALPCAFFLEGGGGTTKSERTCGGIGKKNNFEQSLRGLVVALEKKKQFWTKQESILSI